MSETAVGAFNVLVQAPQQKKVHKMENINMIYVYINVCV